MDIEERRDLIDLILEYDRHIQCYVEEDDAKSLEELDAISTQKLKDLLSAKTARYRFLVDDDIERIECPN